MKKIAVLGSTGSIGTQTLEVIENHLDKFQVVSLVAYSNAELLTLQCKKFKPKYSALLSQEGKDCLIESVKDADVVVFALRGILSIDAVLYCINHDIDVALANKELLVCAGHLVVEALKKSKSKLLPIDSEHSAIWQCLTSKPEKVFLTASGGAFYHLTDEELDKVTVEQALKHPKWNMGAKITIDCATMINKAFEVVEAHHLFGLAKENIDILVHRQSIVHSMVQYQDGSVLAQLSTPDMRLPIQLALLQERTNSQIQKLDFSQLLTLTFEQCDYNRFPLARYGHKVIGNPYLAIVLNASNDICVENFLQGKISYKKIVSTVMEMVRKYENFEKPISTSQDIFKLDNEVRKITQEYIK